MKTYLVTGAAGFIGSNYIKYILSRHEDIGCDFRRTDIRWQL